jgi:hypothetical protein
MDALAASSAVFKRAYCAAPVCSPSRATVLSGLSVENTRVHNNNQTFLGVNPGKKQVDDMFADAGYVKQRYGKVDHFYSSHVAQALPSTMPYANKVCPAPVGEGAFDWGPAPGGDAAQPDYQYAQSGIDFLNATHDKPFFLSVGFVRPHLGWYVPQRFFDLYPKDTLILPSAPPGDLDDLGASGKATALKFNFQSASLTRILGRCRASLFQHQLERLATGLADRGARCEPQHHGLTATTASPGENSTGTSWPLGACHACRR